MEEEKIELLDFSNTSPENYGGKAVILYGCPYRLGNSVGSGTEKYVYPLKNLRTGLSHHVLKIHRGPEADRSLTQYLMILDHADGPMEAMGKKLGPDSNVLVPDLMPVGWCPFTGVVHWRQLMAGSGGSQGFPAMALLMASSAVMP